MIDFTLNEVIITTEVPRELIEKLRMLEEHEWCTFNRIPKVGLLPDKHIEADLLGITLSCEHIFIFISDYGHNGYVIKDLAKYYKFSFKLNHYSTFTLCQGKFEYDHVLDKETSVEINQWDYYGNVSFDNQNNYIYENSSFKYKEELMEYLLLQKIRKEKLDIILEKTTIHKDSLLPARSKRSPLQKLYYSIRVFFIRYMYAIKNKFSHE